MTSNNTIISELFDPVSGKRAVKVRSAQHVICISGLCVCVHKKICLECRFVPQESSKAIASALKASWVMAYGGVS